MQPRRQHLIDTALTLFNQQGYHATGIDLILSQAKVSKATLYKHFRSKDELILAALEQQHHAVLSMISSKINDAEQADSACILTIFDALHEWFNHDTFYGCNFINASAEYSDSQHPIFLFSQKHKQQVVELIKAKLPAGDESKADQIDLLIEGAIVLAHTRGMKQSALMAKKMAEEILEPKK